MRGDGVFVIEVNLRPPGGRVPDLISVVTGYDLHDIATRLALVQPIAVAPKPRAAVGVYRCLTVESPARVFYEPRDLELVSDAVPPLVEIDVEPGAVVYPIKEPEGRIFGRMIAYGESVHAAWSIIREVKAQLGLRAEAVIDASVPSPSQDRAAGATAAADNRNRPIATRFVVH